MFPHPDALGSSSCPLRSTLCKFSSRIITWEPKHSSSASPCCGQVADFESLETELVLEGGVFGGGGLLFLADVRHRPVLPRCVSWLHRVSRRHTRWVSVNYALVVGNRERIGYLFRAWLRRAATVTSSVHSVGPLESLVFFGACQLHLKLQAVEHCFFIFLGSVRGRIELLPGLPSCEGH